VAKLLDTSCARYPHRCVHLDGAYVLEDQATLRDSEARSCSVHPPAVRADLRGDRRVFHLSRVLIYASLLLSPTADSTGCL